MTPGFEGFCDANGDEQFTIADILSVVRTMRGDSQEPSEAPSNPASGGPGLAEGEAQLPPLAPDLTLGAAAADTPVPAEEQSSTPGPVASQPVAALLADEGDPVNSFVADPGANDSLAADQDARDALFAALDDFDCLET
jgi:hypothetical protein